MSSALASSRTLRRCWASLVSGDKLMVSSSTVDSSEGESPLTVRFIVLYCICSIYLISSEAYDGEEKSR